MKTEQTDKPQNGKKRVTVYCDHWQNGGAESYLMNQFRHWDLTKMQLTLLTAEKTTDVYDAELQRLGVRHVVLLDKIYASPIQRILKNLSHCRRYFLQNPCDAAYFNLTNSVTMLYAGFAKWAGVPKRIVHSHNSGLEKSRARSIKYIAHRLARILFSGFATDYWACSDKAAEFLFPAKTAKKALFVPNAIETERYAFCAQSRQRVRSEIHCESSYIVGNIGRCVPQKNQSFLLDVFAELLKQRPEARLLLVGDGPLLPELKQKAQKLGIGDACIFYGFAKAEEIPSLLSAMDVFCLPSKFEGLGIALIEAQANGLSCVASDTVPQIAKLSEQCRMLPAARGFIQQWADALVYLPQADRFGGQQMAERAGFEITSCAKAVQRRLMRQAEKQGAHG